MEIHDIFNPPKNDKVITPYMIAEAGVNHEGDMDLAKRLIHEAKEGGADAIKFQTYKAGTLASKNSPAYWDLSKEQTESQFQLFKKYDKFWKGEYEELKRICDDVEIEFMSTPFDFESAVFLNELMAIFKISSSDLTNKPFIEFLCDFNKPIILSTGASNLSEIQESVDWIKNKGNDLALLHCVLNYPTVDENAYLGMISVLKTKFPELTVGYSDHTMPGDMKNLEIATLLGARIIEKHFTHDKTLPGNDHYHAMDKEDLKCFYSNMDKLLKVLGDDSFPNMLGNQDKSILNARRSIIAKDDLEKGSVLTMSDLTFKRPAFGISPRYIDQVLGKTLNRAIKKDDFVKWQYLDE